MLHLLCHTVSLISPVKADQLYILTKIKGKFEFSCICGICFNCGQWQFTFTVASGTMLSSSLCADYLGLFVFETITTVVQVPFSECWLTVYQISDTQTVCVCVCVYFCCWTPYCGMVHNSTGIYAGFVE